MMKDYCSMIAADWRKSNYYDAAESPGWLQPFWRMGSDFERMFRMLDRRVLVELACGHGRHTAVILPNYSGCERICLLDVNRENVTFCEKRFAGVSAVVSVYQNSGVDFQPILDGEATAIFCYDAMVHFELDTVMSYLKDAWRVLTPGGRVLLHHSNYDKAPGAHYSDNPSWRNFMSKQLFAHIAMRSGFRVLEQVVMDWDVPQTDCLTLLEKVMNVT